MRAQVFHRERHGVPLGAFLVDADVVEKEQHVEFLIGRIGDVLVAFRRDARSLAHIHVAFTPLKHLAAHLGEKPVKTRTVGTERERAGIAFLADRIIGDPRAFLAGQFAVGVDGFGDLGDHVHAETVDAAVHPPVHHPVDGLAHFGILPVEIGLFLGILVEEVFAAFRIVLPCGAAEVGAPLVRLGTRSARFMAGFGRTPPIPIGVRIVLVARSLEPGVLVGRVVHDQIHDDPQTTSVRFGEQFVHVFHRAEQRIDGLIVGDVVAVVVLRGLVYRRQPQHVHAKVREIVESAGDALQIADAVAVGILEGPRIDLVDHRIRPPWVWDGTVGTGEIRQLRTVEISHSDWAPLHSGYVAEARQVCSDTHCRNAIAYRFMVGNRFFLSWVRRVARSGK